MEDRKVVKEKAHWFNAIVVASLSPVTKPSVFRGESRWWITLWLKSYGRKVLTLPHLWRQNTIVFHVQCIEV